MRKILEQCSEFEPLQELPCLECSHRWPLLRQQDTLQEILIPTIGEKLTPKTWTESLNLVPTCLCHWFLFIAAESIKRKKRKKTVDIVWVKMALRFKVRFKIAWKYGMKLHAGVSRAPDFKAMELLVWWLYTQQTNICSISRIGNTRNRCYMCFQLAVKTPELHQKIGVFFVAFELTNTNWVIWNTTRPFHDLPYWLSLFCIL